MKCCRCKGTMVAEKFYLWHEYFSGWRCVTCGEIVDPVIMENRTKPRDPEKASIRHRIGVEGRN